MNRAKGDDTWQLPHKYTTSTEPWVKTGQETGVICSSQPGAVHSKPLSVLRYVQVGILMHDESLQADSRPLGKITIR